MHKGGRVENGRWKMEEWKGGRWEGCATVPKYAQSGRMSIFVERIDALI